MRRLYGEDVIAAATRAEGWICGNDFRSFARVAPSGCACDAVERSSRAGKCAARAARLPSPSRRLRAGGRRLSSRARRGDNAAGRLLRLLNLHQSSRPLLSAPIEGRWLAACLAIALAISLLGGHGHLIFDKGDCLYFVVFSLPLAYFAARISARLDPAFRRILLASVALLLLPPLYRVGANIYLNDLTQKGSIIPQTIAAFAFATLPLELLSSKQLRLSGLGAMLAAAEPALEIYDSLKNPRFAVSDCNFLTHYCKLTPGEDFPSAYIGRLDHATGWIRRDGEPLREERRQCWPDRPQGGQRYNYLLPENWIRLRNPPTAQHDAALRPDAQAQN